MRNARVFQKICELAAQFARYKFWHKDVRLPLKDWQDFERLPVTTRADLKVFVSQGHVENVHNLTATSGSAGTRLLVAHSREAYVTHLRRLTRLYRSIGAEQGQLCLNVCSYELNSGGRLMDAAYKAAGCGVIPLGGLSTSENIKEAVALIKTLRPTILNAYTNQLFDLFSILGRKHSIKKCIVNGEPLWPAYQQRMEHLGGVHIYDHYGSMEVSGFAIKVNPDDTFMKVFGEGLFLEVKDSQGVISEEGTGALLVTDYMNTCMPFVRYQMGDHVQLQRKQGSLWVKVLSRTEDSVLVNGVVVTKTALIHVVNDLLGHPNFFFEIVKNTMTYKDTLIINIPEVSQSKGSQVAKALLIVLGLDNCVVPRVFTYKLPRTANGKIRYFIDAATKVD